MGWRAQIAWIGGAVAGIVLLLPGTSQASETFPEEIRRYLEMGCPPPCTICHETQAGGFRTIKKAFGKKMVQPVAGAAPVLAADQTDKVVPALIAIRDAMPPIDSDSDGLNDVAELEAQRDPNVPSPDGVADALVCPPTYGCGARVAPRPPVDGSALALALVIAGYLALRSRPSA